MSNCLQEMKEKMLIINEKWGAEKGERKQKCSWQNTSLIGSPSITVICKK